MGRKDKPMNRAATAAAKLKAAERASAVWDLRLRGRSIPQIAKELDCAISTVHADLTKQLAEHVTHQRASRDELRAQIAGRLDASIDFLWKAAAAGDVKAVNTLRAIEADRARLFGLHDHDEDLVIPGVPLGADGLPIPAAPSGPGGALFRVMSAEEVETIRASTRKSAGVLPAE